MISRLVELEQQRLSKIGYDSIVTPLSMTIGSSISNICLGNDTYILTGIRMSDADVADDRHTVIIASATHGLTATQRDISLMGQAIFRIMRSYLIIRTFGNDKWTDASQVPPYTLDFIKITPIPTNTIKR